MNDNIIKLFQIIIICGTVIFLFLKFQSPKIDQLDYEIIKLEREKLRYEFQVNQYMLKVDSLENHIKSLEIKKQENTIIANKKKNAFRELAPNEKVIVFNTLFKSLISKNEPK